MTTQGRIASLSTPAWTLAALAASVESGLAAALDEPRAVEELAERTGLPVAVVDALVEVLATMELAERIGAHCCRASPCSPRPASSRMPWDAGATPTSSCSRRRGACRRA